MNCPAAMHRAGSIMQICAYWSASDPCSATSIVARLRSSACSMSCNCELAGAITPGNGGIDRFRRRRDRLDQLEAIIRNRHHRAALIGLRHAAFDQVTCFEVAQDAGQARPEQKCRPRQFGDLCCLDRGQRAQDAPLLFGQPVLAQRG